ncbi:hypothetical protein QBC40DRAFT_318889 [Triangularia verruculosa]|uniref:Uncharacterized protein n=1 Tax=Triangularia verruculosa TaxID=2587418 RepID=A0AAN6X624_9PEZI|nr:hypothetical protein QBC40DRAFT_318889 [Triangularia verruculosa]
MAAPRYIQDILTRPNPGLTDKWNGTINTIPRRNKYDVVDISSVTKWTDFTYDAINLAYGDILKTDINTVAELNPYRAPHSLSETPTTICEESDLRILGFLWSCNIVRGPLKAAALALRPRLTTAGLIHRPENSNDSQQSVPQPPTITLAPNTGVLTWATKFPAAEDANDSQGTEGEEAGEAEDKDDLVISTDWIVFDRELFKTYHFDAEKTEKPVVYTLGVNKLAQEWQSDWLELADLDAFLGPLQQVATYCRYVETRYAYIITQKELVALRVSALPSSEDGVHHAAIEYAAIPWESSDGLTVNLAIWALGCMGLNDEYRGIDGPKARLTDWVRHHDPATEADCYQNVISKREIAHADWDDAKDSRFFTFV